MLFRSMNDGHVTQFGPTADIYRAPHDLVSAAVFSDPPINSSTISKQGDQAVLNDSTRWPLTGDALGLRNGDYTVAVRPVHVSPLHHLGDAVALTGKVQVTELSGSISSAHFQIGDSNWVSLSHGVHPYQIGEDHTFYMDTTKCFYFTADGKRVA